MKWLNLYLTFVLAAFVLGCNGSTHHALDCIPETYCTTGCPVCDQPPCEPKTHGDDDDDPSIPRGGDDDDSDDPDGGDDDDDDSYGGDDDDDDDDDDSSSSDDEDE